MLKLLALISPLLACSIWVIPVTAQSITSDDSVGTRVETEDNVHRIEGGTIRGENLFHSFENFSLPTGEEASFIHNSEISNIINRVTGGNISNLDGLIRAGNVNLILINPNGINFGPNASLNIGGSFYASTAEGVVFADGTVFSATDSSSSSLTIAVPTGLQWGPQANPSPIRIQGFTEVNLPVGSTLGMVGGEIAVNNAQIIAPGVNTTLIGVAGEGLVTLKREGNLGIAEGIARANLTITDSLLIPGATGEITPGNLTLLGQAINIDNSDLKVSTAGSEDAGVIEVDAQGNLNIVNSRLYSKVQGGAEADAGLIEIQAANLDLSSNSYLDTSVEGIGIPGRIVITVDENITLSDSLVQVGLGNGGVNPQTSGGEIQITAQNLYLLEQEGIGGNLRGTSDGQGNGSKIEINLRGTLELEGSGSTIRSSARNRTGQDGFQGGEITINADTVYLANEAAIQSAPIDINQGGSIFLQAETLTIVDGAGITVATGGSGSSGNIVLQVERLELTNNNPNELQLSRISAEAQTETTGDGGTIQIQGDNLSIFLDPRSEITSKAVGLGGDGGNITITGESSLAIEGGGAIQVSTDGLGDAGNIELNAPNLSLNGINIAAQTAGEGNGGDITIRGDNFTAQGATRITASTQGVGDAGLINFLIDQNLSLGGGTAVSALTEVGSTGDAGRINLSGAEMISVNQGARVEVDSQGSGGQGTITISGMNLELDQGLISANTASSDQNAGNVTLIIGDRLNLQTSQILANADGQNADGGNINLTTSFLILEQGSLISANAGGVGTGGTIVIDALSVFQCNNCSIEARSAQGEQGTIIFTNPDSDPTTIDTDIPQEIPDPNTIVTSACPLPTADQNLSRIYLIGRGGLPPRPGDTISADALISFDTPETTSETGEQSSYPPPANGWYLNPQGEVIITNNLTQGSPHSQRLVNQYCSD